MASNTSTQINSSDPSVAKQIQRETDSLLRQPTLASAPSINGSASATTTPISQAIRSLAPIVNGSERFSFREPPIDLIPSFNTFILPLVPSY